MASNGFINRLPGGNQDENNGGGTNCCLYEGDHFNRVGFQVTA